MFFQNHPPMICNLNNENLGGSIEMIFCKDHSDYHNPNRIVRPKGSYIIVDSEDNITKIWLKKK